MSAIQAMWKNGQIIPVEPVCWPEGCLLRVEPELDLHGASGDIQADDPESVARWIAEFDAVPPLDMTPAEEAAWRQARQAQKELETATFHNRADELRSLIE
jgi:hypothetical protein